MDWRTKLEGGEEESYIESRHVPKSPATRWNAGRFTSVIVQGSTHGSGSRRQCCRGVERIRASRSRCGMFPTDHVVLVLRGEGGPQGSKWNSVRPEARPAGAVQETGGGAWGRMVRCCPSCSGW